MQCIDEILIGPVVADGGRGDLTGWTTDIFRWMPRVRNGKRNHHVRILRKLTRRWACLPVSQKCDHAIVFGVHALSCDAQWAVGGGEKKK